ncbi:MAG: GntR family transcriptional regulator [Actinotalea sp.]|nr:GntR family transcriptional regulator [Actinotalea sp.]
MPPASAGPRLVVDPASSVPPFEQVRQQIEQQAASGVLPPGARLPTVRGLAAELGLAANTVARAYRELEQDGVVVTRGRSGTVVAVRGEDREREGRVAATAFARRVRELGLDPDVALRLVRDALR